MSFEKVNQVSSTHSPAVLARERVTRATRPHDFDYVPPIVHEILREPGQPLDTSTREFFEPRFGTDFSSVRVHTGAKAAASARAVEARAYAAGTQLVFNEGEFESSTTEGRRLLAHELAHVVQQAGSTVPERLTLGDARSSLEDEADATADAVARDGPPQLRSAGQPALQRQLDGDMPADVEDEVEVEDGDSPAGSTLDVADVEEDEGGEEDEEAVGSEEAGVVVQYKKGPKKGGGKKKPRVIRRVNVNLSTQKLTVEWSDGQTSKPVPISSGKGLPDTKDDPCKDPNLTDSNCTPVGNFHAGKKGDADYKNKKGDHMSWYVEFEADRAIGIHDSQPVTGSPASHGCVRVDEGTARLINRSVTPRTEIVVTGKAPTKPYSKPKPKPKPKLAPSGGKPPPKVQRIPLPLGMRPAPGFIQRVPQQPTLEEARRSGKSLPKQDLSRMDVDTLTRKSADERKQWYVDKLGAFERQLHESASIHLVPIQLLATVILNELADISLPDIVQSDLFVEKGSLGIAQIQIDTAKSDQLFPDLTEAEGARAYDEFIASMPANRRTAARWMRNKERETNLAVNRRLQIPQHAIDAAGREVRLLLNQMMANVGKPWQQQFSFTHVGIATPRSAQAIYDDIAGGSQKEKEMNLANLITGAYNSPKVITAVDSGMNKFPNANIHGRNSRLIAGDLFDFGLFRP
jgi:lipoprotein-anchoring transpeptidase ErfK/SrfK